MRKHYVLIYCSTNGLRKSTKFDLIFVLSRRYTGTIKLKLNSLDSFEHKIPNTEFHQNPFSSFRVETRMRSYRHGNYFILKAHHS